MWFKSFWTSRIWMLISKSPFSWYFFPVVILFCGCLVYALNGLAEVNVTSTRVHVSFIHVTIWCHPHTVPYFFPDLSDSVTDLTGLFNKAVQRVMMCWWVEVKQVLILSVVFNWRLPWLFVGFCMFLATEIAKSVIMSVRCTLSPPKFLGCWYSKISLLPCSTDTVFEVVLMCHHDTHFNAESLI